MRWTARHQVAGHAVGVDQPLEREAVGQGERDLGPAPGVEDRAGRGELGQTRPEPSVRSAKSARRVGSRAAWTRNSIASSEKRALRSSIGWRASAASLPSPVGCGSRQLPDLLQAAVDDLVEQREEEAGLALVGRVDGPLRVAGVLGDLVERGAVVAVGEEAPLGDVEQTAPGQRGPLAAGQSSAPAATAVPGGGPAARAPAARAGRAATRPERPRAGRARRNRAPPAGRAPRPAAPDVGGEVLGQQQRREVGGDLEVGGVELRAAKHPGLDPRVDLVEPLAAAAPCPRARPRRTPGGHRSPGARSAGTPPAGRRASAGFARRVITLGNASWSRRAAQ